MRRIVLSLSICVALGAGCKKTEVSRTIPWRFDLDDALVDAAKQRKPAVVFVGADWDCGTAEYKHKAFTDVRLRRRLEDFIPIYVDGTESEDFLEQLRGRFRVVGVPTIIILDADQTERARIMTYVPPEKLVATLAQH